MPPRKQSTETLRQLGAPRRVSVEADERGRPLAVFRERAQRWIRVRQIQDRWRIDDCWWQVETYGEVSRMYFALELQAAQLLTVFRDLLTGYWYEQRDSTPKDQPQPIDVFSVPQGSVEREGLNIGALPPDRQRIGWG